MRNATTYALWTIQGLLAVVFLFAGGMKLVMPIEEMTKQMPSMPGWFLHFIGSCEILGGLGLILPGLFRVRPGLTPLAAAGLVVIMIGATVINIVDGPAPAAILTAALGAMCAFVVYGRWLRPSELTAATKART